MIPSTPLRLSAPADRLSVSHHNGPGLRVIVWVQGCSIRCTRNCLNPHLLAASGGVSTTTDALLEAVLRTAQRYDELEGITILGGEPFDQAAALAVVLGALTERSLSTMIYTGHVLETLVKRHDRSIDALLRATDILVDGPFIDELYDPALIWRGSSNQRLLPLSGRYSSDDVQRALDVQKRGAFLSVRPLHDVIASGAQSTAAARQLRQAVRRRSAP
jgi:anaerobic ribonucleoside-triphosphate reductase activating protein